MKVLAGLKRGPVMMPPDAVALECQEHPRIVYSSVHAPEISRCDNRTECKCHWSTRPTYKDNTSLRSLAFFDAEPGLWAELCDSAIGQGRLNWASWHYKADWRTSREKCNRIAFEDAR